MLMPWAVAWRRGGRLGRGSRLLLASFSSFVSSVDASEHCTCT
jgi:hypothetical protein